MTGAQDNEFNVVAGWTADELVGRDTVSQLAGASRGSGGPSALAWLAESLGLRPGTHLLDVGAGLGGPAAWITERYGVWPVAVEPMVDADQGSALLFDHPIVAASASALPLRAASFDAAWILAVLDTVSDPLRVLIEVRRTLIDDGRLGILAYLARAPIEPDVKPAGNHFQSEAELHADLRAAGFAVVDRAAAGRLVEAPIDWQLRQEHVEDRLAERHGDDPRWLEAKANEEAFASLLTSGQLEPVLLHAMCV
jgi:ubiquinone/menaquinone biosynthesis C-methylase UbiE